MNEIKLIASLIGPIENNNGILLFEDILNEEKNPILFLDLDSTLIFDIGSSKQVPPKYTGKVYVFNKNGSRVLVRPWAIEFTEELKNNLPNYSIVIYSFNGFARHIVDTVGINYDYIISESLAYGVFRDVKAHPASILVDDDIEHVNTLKKPKSISKLRKTSLTESNFILVTPWTGDSNDKALPKAFKKIMKKSKNLPQDIGDFNAIGPEAKPRSVISSPNQGPI